MKSSKMKKTTRTSLFLLLAGALFFWSILLVPMTLQAAPDIHASYIQGNGTQLVIGITIGPNPPALVILVQQFPPGVRMIDSSPIPRHYNSQRNRAKWLLRNLQPGKSTISMTLDRPVQRNQISAEIRFKPRRGADMETMPVLE